MLFDLRSRGRRRTVQVVYLGLAVLMGGGLVLFGVGAGNGIGGLLNAFTGGGSSSGRSPVVSQQEKTALKADPAEAQQPRGLGRPGQRPLDSRRHGQRLQLRPPATYTAAGQKELGHATARLAALPDS